MLPRPSLRPVYFADQYRNKPSSFGLDVAGRGECGQAGTTEGEGQMLIDIGRDHLRSWMKPCCRHCDVSLLVRLDLERVDGSSANHLAFDAHRRARWLGRDPEP